MAIDPTGSSSPRRAECHRVPRPVIGLAVVALTLPMTVLFTAGADAASTSVPLGTASSFAVLAGAGITNTGPTTIAGDIGTYPTTTITGAASLTLTGTNHAGDATTQQAKTDLVTAYNNAAGEGPTSPISADLGGRTLTPGVYNSASSVGLTGTLTLDGGGDANAVFIFQAGSTLTTASASKVVLSNGAQSCNVFWQVGSSATLGTGSSFRGTIVALTSITVTTSATIDGRVLARNGAVTLDTDTITTPTCATTTAGASTPTTTASNSTATTAPATVAAKIAAANKAAAKKAAAKKTAARKAAAKKIASPKPVSFAKPPITHRGFTG